jgi:two-component system response regulator HydG
VTQAIGAVHRVSQEAQPAHIPPAVPSAANGGFVAGTGPAHAPIVSGHSNGRGAIAHSSAEQLARELGVIGGDPCLRLAVETAATIAPTWTPVLIVGERGTGKALLARVIHAMGSRGDQPFVTVDGSALTEATLQRERTTIGAGGQPPRPDSSFDWSSKLVQAQGGTLFLNDLSALSDGLQLLLFRALQDRGNEAHAGYAPHADVRFLMSSGENLISLVEQAKFRQDLYHRASVVCLRLPPLRHRGGDLLELAEYFRTRYSHEFGKNVVGFTRDALEILSKHDWPGNVRELEGVIQRGVSLCQGTRITSGHLSPSLCHPRSSRFAGLAPRGHVPASIRPLKEALEEPEKRIIIQALQALNWNRQETARVLDINRTTLYKKMKKYGLLVDEPIWVN